MKTLSRPDAGLGGVHRHIEHRGQYVEIQVDPIPWTDWARPGADLGAVRGLVQLPIVIIRDATAARVVECFEGFIAAVRLLPSLRADWWRMSRIRLVASRRPVP